ncbi:hypothetical protein ABK040_007754 [Willaertia magna]
MKKNGVFVVNDVEIVNNFNFQIFHLNFTEFNCNGKKFKNPVVNNVEKYNSNDNYKRLFTYLACCINGQYPQLTTVYLNGIHYESGQNTFYYYPPPNKGIEKMSFKVEIPKNNPFICF